MKSLYETILSTTNSGKKGKLNEKYLLDYGFKKSRINNMYELILRDHYFYLTAYKDLFYVKVPRIDKGIIDSTKHFVQTYADFDLVLDYWNAVANNAPQLEIVTKKQLVREKLKRF